MLGYDARIYEIAPNVGTGDLQRIGNVPYAARGSIVDTLTAQQVAYVPYRAWVDRLLTASEEGRARILHDGGYPYLFHAQGAEIKANFGAAGVPAISALKDATWYLVEAWDQS